MLQNGVLRARDRDSSARSSSGNSQRSEATGIEGSTRPPSSNSQQSEVTEIEDESSSYTRRKLIKCVDQTKILSVALLADGQHFVSGDNNGKIRRWRIGDGEEVGPPMDMGSAVRCLVASQDGKWIAAGAESGRVIVWDAETREKANEFAYKKAIDSVDISSDGKKIAIASDDNTVDIWSLPDDKWLCGRMDSHFHTVRFSPDGSLFAVGVESSFLSIFHSQNGDRLSGIRVSVLSVSWASDSKQLFILSSDGNIYCIDAYSEATLSKWSIHSNDSPRYISLSSNGTFIATYANASVSFWDTSTHKQIGVVSYQLYSQVNCMAISPNYDLVIAGDSAIVLWDLLNVLSTPKGQKRATGFQMPEMALKDTIAKLRSQLANAQRTAIQKEDTLDKTIKTLQAELEVQNTKSMDLDNTVKELRIRLSDSLQNAKKIIQQSNTELANSKRVILAHRQKHKCETLYADGHVIDSAKSLLDITKSINDEVRSDTIIMDWLSGFTNKCLAALEQIGDEASRTRNDEEALAAYVAALPLCSPNSNNFLNKWVRTMLIHRSTNQVLDGARELELPIIAVCCAICDVLEGDGRFTEAISCFKQVRSELAQATGVGKRVQWEVDFQQRCTEGLEKLAEVAFKSQNYDEADRLYSTILSLDPVDRVHTLIQRSHARAMKESWEDALKDADEAIELDPSSHRGYERRHAALHGARHHAEAVAAFDMMLLKLQQSPDTCVRALRSQYPNARRIIRGIIQATTSHMPRVLIDTTTGHLCDRTQLAQAFEALPIFNELISSMTREIDYTWIRREANEFCRYVMFSHKWENGEPLFQKVMNVTVYKLEASRGNIKLQTFCSIVQSLGFRWAWSDTCCIDRDSHVVLQESLIAMFAWYRGSSLTIIHLLGVSSLSEVMDALRQSIWNSRVWTYQEYVAAKRVLFYTDDWKRYLDMTLENHKESPTIVREMEMSQVSSEQVAVLQPGLDRVREKLCLASTRETTLVEDIAYSLLGILNAPIPVMYGEGTRAVGRLLEYVLTGSGDATILAWTGTANDYNSCLPVNLTVYETVIPPHVPHMETAELDHAVTALRSSILDHSLITALYGELNKLPSPTLSSSRLRLPGILSCLNDVEISGQDGQTYRATTDLFGDIEIKTASNLAMMKGLCLVHPWIRPLLDQEFDRGSAGLDSTTQALRLIARLHQPFGALLFEQVSRTEYKRVAADSLIMIQFREASFSDLMGNIRTIEIL